MNSRELADTLRDISEASGAHELALVTTFKGYRHNVALTIDVRDAGPEEQAYRYTVMATDEHGRTATGNPGAHLGDVLREVHWRQLDQPQSAD